MTKALSRSGRRSSARLAILAFLHRGQVVPSERLIEELWGGRARDGGKERPGLRLAAAQGARRETRDARRGYVLELEPRSSTSIAFRPRGRRTTVLAQGDANRAAELLRAAPALWRGPPLVDFRYEPFAQTEIQRWRSSASPLSGPDRGGSRARPAHDTRRRARGACPGAPATRASACAADARSLPFGPAGRGARELPAGA